MAKEFGEYRVWSGFLVSGPLIGWESWNSPVPRAVVQGHLDHRLVTASLMAGTQKSDIRQGLFLSHI